MEITLVEALLILGILAIALGGFIAMEWVRHASRPACRVQPERARPERVEVERSAAEMEETGFKSFEDERRPKGGMVLTRRRLFHWLMGISAAGALGAMLSAANSLKPLVVQQAAKLIGAGDRLAFASGARRGQIITRESLKIGEAALALPQGKEDVEENIVLVVRLNPDELSPPVKQEWTAEGFVAYSAICTHLGCTVVEELRAGGIFCPCHAAVFNPRRGAIVVSGPPPRPLPQLPLRFNAQGELEAAGGFTEPVGF
jgi:rieske iron-sulfur protein